MNAIVQAFMDETEIDYIALPQIASAARWDFGAQTTDEARELSLEIVRPIRTRPPAG
jgi:hypothetical protein